MNQLHRAASICFHPCTTEKIQSAIVRLENILTIKQHESITPGGKHMLPSSYNRKNSTAKICFLFCFCKIVRPIYLVKQELEFLIPDL